MNGFSLQRVAGRKQEGSLPGPRIVNLTIGHHHQRRRPMIRTILTAAVLLCASQAASAQELTSEQRSACMGDYEKYCKGVTPGGGRIIACLAKETDKLTPACKKVLAEAEKK
jgi:hypothetical protein